MTFFLRNQDNQTVVDIELFKKDGCVELNSTVCIKPYSQLLLEQLISEKDESEIRRFIQEFDDLSELRGWLWESYFAVRKNTVEEFDNVSKELKEKLMTVAKKYNLRFVRD